MMASVCKTGKMSLLLGCLILEEKNQAFPSLDFLFSGNNKSCGFFFYF